MAVEGADVPSPASSPNGVFRVKPDGSVSRTSRSGDGQHVTAEGAISCGMTMSSFIDSLAASTRHPAGARSVSVADGASTHASPRSAPRTASASLTSRHITPVDHAVSLRSGSRYADASTQRGQGGGGGPLPLPTDTTTGAVVAHYHHRQHGDDAPRRPRSASRRPARDLAHAEDDSDDEEDKVEERGDRGAVGGRDDADGRAGATDPLAGCHAAAHRVPHRCHRCHHCHHR